MRTPALVLLLVLSTSACGGDAAAGGGGEVAVDTLANGAIRTRNPEKGLWGSGQAWRAVETARIGSADAAEPAYVFGEVVDATTDPLGRVWVLDRQAKELRVFDAAGRHLRTVGREGAGPGEFRNPIGLSWDAQARLWVVDTGNQRYEVFDTAGRHVHSYRRSIEGWGLPWGGGFDRKGSFLYEPTYYTDPASRESRHAYVRHRLQDQELAATDTFPLPDHVAASYEVRFAGGSSFMRVPYTPELLWHFDGEQGLWMGMSDRYRLYRRALAGDTVRVVERAHRPLAVSTAERDSVVASLEEASRPGPNMGGRVSGPLDYGRIPAVKPAFRGVVVDDRGYLWVAATAADAGRGGRWDVFDAEGRYLGPVAMELDVFPLPRIRGSTVVGVRRDELDVPQVVVYRLEGAGRE
jgi:hypothetical protein